MGHEVINAPSDRNSTGFFYWIPALLLLIFIQMLTSLVVFGGEFICSNEMTISPFHLCPIQHGKKVCDVWQQPNFDTKVVILTALIIVSLYTPLVFVAFALLSSLFAAYSSNGTILRLSVALQAASSLLILIGVFTFTVLNQPYLSWKDITIWFYICYGAHLQLVVSTVLSHVFAKKLNSECGLNQALLADKML